MRTVLYDTHCALGAKVVDFQGWEMPIQYKGIILEHQAVRNNVGLFDVSHMGRIFVEGPDSFDLLNYLSTNELRGKEAGTATYTVWCHDSGMCVDDLLIYRQAEDKFFIIVNAGNRQKDLDHLLRHAHGRNVIVKDHYQSDAILALQGPKANALLIEKFPQISSLKTMHFMEADYEGEKIVISRTGYTGAGGVEIYLPNEKAVSFWNYLMEAGKAFGIEPVGLGARDTLRLEKGYALYGHEISETIAPTESVAAWSVKWNKGSFIGRRALEKVPKKRAEYGIILTDKGIAREGYSVFLGEEEIGRVTSGTFSPTLNQAIAIVLVERNLAEGDIVEVQVRQNRCRACVVPLPFVK